MMLRTIIKSFKMFATPSIHPMFWQQKECSLQTIISHFSVYSLLIVYGTTEKTDIFQLSQQYRAECAIRSNLISDSKPACNNTNREQRACQVRSSLTSVPQRDRRRSRLFDGAAFNGASDLTAADARRGRRTASERSMRRAS